MSIVFPPLFFKTTPPVRSINAGMVYGTKRIANIGKYLYIYVPYLLTFKPPPNFGIIFCLHCTVLHRTKLLLKEDYTIFL